MEPNSGLQHFIVSEMLDFLKNWFPLPDFPLYTQQTLQTTINTSRYLFGKTHHVPFLMIRDYKSRDNR